MRRATITLILAVLLGPGTGSGDRVPGKSPLNGIVRGTHFLRVHESARLSALLPEGVAASAISWYVASPIAEDYDNYRYCGEHPASGCHQPIHYRVGELPEVRGQLSFDVKNVTAFASPGTYLIGFQTGTSETQSGRNITESEAQQLFKVVIRRDDTYVGFLTELFGVPFVLWPQRLPGRGHQTDLQIGADCVALVIYGRRRMGFDTPYVAPSALSRFMTVVSDTTGTGGRRIRVGDVLNFGFQTAVVAENRDPTGMLSDDDLIIHTYHGMAEELPFSRLPYRNHPFEVLRWNQAGIAPKASFADAGYLPRPRRDGAHFRSADSAAVAAQVLSGSSPLMNFSDAEFMQ